MNRPILLVNPNLMKPPVTPVGLDYVGQALRDAGHEVVLLDLAWADDVEAAVRSAAACGPLLVGVSVRNLDDCFFASRAFCLEQTRGILDAIRRHTDASLVLGGVGFSIAPQAALRYCAADWGVAGDGEAALASLANAFAQKGDPRSIPGLVYRQGDGCVSNPIQWPDLAAFPVATRDLVDNRRYLAEGGQVGFETKRGCDHSCAYCADPLTKGRRVRLRDPRAVADELEGLVSRGVDCFHTCDAEFNAPPAHALAVCEETARRGLGDRMRWYAYAEPRAFDETLAAAMRRAGCAGINFGVDHANPGLLAALGRRHGHQDLVRAADLCRRHGMAVMYDLILGGPGETPDTVREVIAFLRQVQPDRVGASVGVRLYAHTPLTDRIRREGGLAPTNPHLRGRLEGNPDLLEPVFYVSADLGPDPEAVVEDCIAGDPRFFFARSRERLKNYNYNDNAPLCDAIRRGCRGAYWDILRRLAEQPGA